MRTNKHVYGERTFWVKGREAHLVEARALTVFVRLGDRSAPNKAPLQWLPLFEPIPVYSLIFGTGDQDKGVMPRFELDRGVTVQIVRRTVGRLGDFKSSDLRFKDGSAVAVLPEALVEYLEVEMYPGKKFPPETIMTVYWVEYLPDQEPATD